MEVMATDGEDEISNPILSDRIHQDMGNTPTNSAGLVYSTIFN